MTSAPQPVEIPGARAAIYRDPPSLDGLRTAAVGDFSCDTAEAGAALLQQVAGMLASEGFGAVLGPMNGDTWRAYRLVVESDGRKPFLMEPHNPDWYPAAFDAAGWTIVSRYGSAVRPAVRPDPPGEASAHAAARFRLRSFRPDRAEDDLRAIHALSLATFSANPFYRPIDVDSFLGAYRPMVPMLDPDLVLLAEDETGQACGFVFAVPDLAQGPAPDTLILKTYASTAKGLGSRLAYEIHTRAHERGFAHVIHALMHADNLSARHSGNTGGTVFRRYALWGRRL